MTALFNPFYKVAFFFLMGAALVVIIYFLNWFLAPRTKHTSLSDEAYESGDPSVGSGWGKFHLGFYPFALLFVVFDVEALFLFAWAAAFHELGLFGVIEVFAFIVMLVVGLIYAWRKGVLRWM